ncbi:MAG: hypothetical protein JNL03_01025 [Prolixibacteraceae bacterium]|nr:hypothetical protein [Prolixibacteraceae bacterium]
MKTLLILLSGVLYLGACSPALRIVEVKDAQNEVEGTRLVFSPEAYSEVKSGEWIGRTHYNLTSVCRYERERDDRPTVSVDFRVVVPVGMDDPDSVMIFDLDDEKIRIVSGQYRDNGENETAGQAKTVSTSGDKKSYELKTCGFIIPENLWIPVASSKVIKWRLFLGKTGVEVKLNEAETKKLKSFFSQAVSELETHFPAIPEGQKKW